MANRNSMIIGGVLASAASLAYLAARSGEEQKKAEKAPIRVLITGAAGQIGYALIPNVCNGSAFGDDQPIILHLLDIPRCAGALEGVVMEIEDSAYPLLRGVVPTTDIKTAFTDIDFAVFVGGFPRLNGMVRADLIAKNSPIFSAQGQALNDYAKKTCKSLVVANPANTNCFILRKNAPSIPTENFSCLTRLDYNRAVGVLSGKFGVPAHAIRDVIVWGNHSETMVPDVSRATFTDAKGNTVTVKSQVDSTWLKETFKPTIQKRGGAIIKARGASSALSAAQAITNHLRDWTTGSGRTVCMGVVSDGSYGIAEGLVFSFPVRVTGDGSYSIVQGLSIDEETRADLTRTEEQLKEELSATNIN